MKKLYLIRHAKSSWDNPSLSDFARPLNPRGKRDAPLMANILNKKEIRPDKIVSSPAKRALSTAEVFALELDYPLNEIQKEEKIYHGSVNDLSECINSFEKSWKTVFLFGHNPGLTYFAEYLCGEHFGNIPTTGIVALEFHVDSWQEVSRNSGRNFFYDYPKKH